MKTIKNIFKLALFFTIISLAVEVKAQIQDVHFDVDNNLGAPPGCDWTITIYDASSVAQYSFVVPSGTRMFGTAGCISYNGNPMNYVTVDDGSCTLTFNSSLGSIPYVDYISPCSGTTCSSRIDGSGSLSGSGCATNGFMIIRIF